MPAILAYWRASYSADMFRRFAYAIAALPLASLSLVLMLAGQGQKAARFQRQLAGKLVWPETGQAPTRPTSPKVLAASIIILAVGVACWLLLWRFTYALLPLPLAANCLALILMGRIPAMARYQRRMASGPSRPVPHRTRARVAVHSIAMVAVGLICWLLLAYLLVFAVGNLAFPFLISTGSAPAYGGPPPPWVLLSNLRISFDRSIWARTYDAAQFVVMLYPLLAWAIRGLTWLQGWLTQALLGVGPRSALR